MLRRVIAAIIAVVLVAVGVLLVLRYAQSADERALDGMQTDTVYVASERIDAGTPAAEITERVEARDVPRQFQVEGAVSDLTDLTDRVTVADLAPGEQLRRDQWLRPEELRTRSDFELPEEAQDLHQLTISLDTARALGGDVAAGDSVGVLMSFEAEFEEGLYVDDAGNVQWNSSALGGEDTEAEATQGSANISLTKLVLEKVLVTGVRGGYVREPAVVAEEGAENEDEGPQDQILVTLALDGGQSEQLVYAMEFGTVWLTRQPESSVEDDEDIKVIRLPERAGDVLE